MGSIKKAFDLTGKNALVTGGSRGLGLQIAEALGEHSTSISRPRSCLRATNSARTSCEPIDLACTGRNQPIRISWASPRASLRSVFTIIADNAAFTCRVSSRTVSNPARFSPACSHADNGPASSPIRFTAKPSDAKKATRASGSLATFVSLTILPCASTTQTLESSNETSIPA